MEELIGEEIVDETDLYIDVHRYTTLTANTWTRSNLSLSLQESRSGASAAAVPPPVRLCAGGWTHSHAWTEDVSAQHVTASSQVK